MFSKTLLVFLVVYFSSDFSHGQRAKHFFRKDYSYIEATESFYKIHTTPQTFADAVQVCALEGASLFYAENSNEADAVTSFWKGTLPNITMLFVGLSDTLVEGSFETIDRKPMSEVYNNWHSGEPNDWHGLEDCVYLTQEATYYDCQCNATCEFICKKSLLSLERNYSGNMPKTDGQRDKKYFRKDYTYIEALDSFYKIHTIPRNWFDAKRVCAQEGATFFYPENDNEAHAVILFWNTTRPHIRWMYVGMSVRMDERLFETVDGKSISDVYNNWQAGQPDNAGGAQDCVYIYKEGFLDDYSCGYNYSFICKKSLQSVEWNYNCNMPDLDYTFSMDTGKCYKLHTTPMTWKEAYGACRRERSSLAMISSRLEADYLANLTESTVKPRVSGNYQRGIYHLGFHNIFNEGWQTVKGTPMKVDADVWWDNYQPDERDECGSMFFNGRLINTDCNMRSFFICEHEADSLNSELEDNKII